MQCEQCIIIYQPTQYEIQKKKVILNLSEYL